MKRVLLTIGLCTVLSMWGLSALAAGVNHTKVTPYGLGYPLIIPGRHTVPGSEAFQRNQDVYRQSFGVRRMFRGIRSRDYATTLLETLNWHALYGSYGVTGHGEDVFTDRAARYRKAHQGD